MGLSPGAMARPERDGRRGERQFRARASPVRRTSASEAASFRLCWRRLSGKSVLVVSPTGSGKTLCFQLPAVLRQGVSLVVCPLKTLMSEQVSDLLKKKIPATFINSDLTAEEKETRFSLLVAPGLQAALCRP